MHRISVYYCHSAIGRLASNAFLTIDSEAGSKTVSMDSSCNAGDWNVLGIATDPDYVRLTNGADDVIVADAVKFQRLD